MTRLAWAIVALGILTGTALAGDGSARLLWPMTSGTELRGQERPRAGEQRLALAPANAAVAAKAMTAHPGTSAKARVVIDVMVAYTRKAAGYYSDIERDLVALAIEVTNDSFRSSNLDHIELRLVHAYQTDYVERGATHFDHVWRLADRGDGHMEEVHALRDRHRADVAMLIVDDATGCGLTTRVQADAEEAFAVAHHECAAASYTLAHEVGHIIGARHELGYVNGTKWRDIMASKESCGGCPRVPVWSNPVVLVGGEPAGTAQLDNARIIAEQAWRVAAFR